MLPMNSFICTRLIDHRQRPIKMRVERQSAVPKFRANFPAFYSCLQRNLQRRRFAFSVAFIQLENLLSSKSEKSFSREKVNKSPGIGL